MDDTFSILEIQAGDAGAIYAVPVLQWAGWLAARAPAQRNWLESSGFAGKAGSHSLLPGEDGGLAAVCVLPEQPDVWSLAALPMHLPAGVWKLADPLPPKADIMALGWALAGYQFARFKKRSRDPAQLIAPQGSDVKHLRAQYEALCWARDLINRPPNDLTPEALAQEAAEFGRQSGCKVRLLAGKALLDENYPLIHAVGRAASVPPQLVDLRFGGEGPKVTLVGKGVTFDSGGLNLKTGPGMKLMKKDMGGAACALALARLLVESKFKIQLRVLLPIVENSVSGDAMRPMDVVKSRKGLTVEIGNTDAEGRLILCDALAEADSESPDLLIDLATLTGAARVALGADIPAFFTPDDALADELARHSKETSDPVWRLPLWPGYRSQLDTQAADISNDPDNSYGGAITAALYLKEFVTTPSWLHIDLMAWNQSDRPGRPKGGEAMAVRALYSLLKERYGR